MSANYVEVKRLRDCRAVGLDPNGCGQERGFTLVELMIAITVLAIGMLGAMGMMLMGMQNDSRNKTDTNATVLDQEVIEFYSTIKTYPKPTFVTINDCAPAGSAHEADMGQGASPTGNGAVLYTAATAPTPAQIGDIDWTQAAPAFATAATPGYAMNYQTCSGEIYEVRWNVMDLTPAAPPAGTNGRLSLLTVSARQKSAVDASAGAAKNRAVLYALPVTLRSMIETTQ
jgi:prepilin-type N-terminal cleavage/methylation domain-containing protein